MELMFFAKSSIGDLCVIKTNISPVWLEDLPLQFSSVLVDDMIPMM